MRIWDTAHNNGVLIYLLLADRDVEIIADRGIDAKVGAAGWEKICKAMETDFKAGNFAGGVIKGIEAVSRQLAAHFPAHGAGPQRTAGCAGGDLANATSHSPDAERVARDPGQFNDEWVPALRAPRSMLRIAE